MIRRRYQFPPMNPLWHSLLGFTIGVLGFISMTGNGMVIYIFMTTKVQLLSAKRLEQSNRMI